MESKKVGIAFVVASNGPSVFDEESQAERKALLDTLGTEGVPFSYPDNHGMAFDSASELLEIVVASGVAFRSLRPVMIEWIKGRAGQVVRISSGDKRIEAPDIESAERAWRLISPEDDGQA